MESLFTALTSAVTGSPLISTAAAFVWGTISVLLSPCHLSSVPLIVAYLTNRENVKPFEAALMSSVFAVGILISIGAVGFATAALGRMAGDIGRTGSVLVAAVLVFVGLYLVGALRISWSFGAGVPGSIRKGYPAALLLGLVFGTALGPCTFAFMAPVLAAAFGTAAISAVWSAALITAFALGHCLVVVAAGTSAGAVQLYLKSRVSTGAGELLRKMCGLLVVLAGLYIVVRAFS
ncbi:MAG: cytochrome c biogenesis CcdA family protein [Armatimonadota bacterium]